ncbi:hypothetical protein ACFE04_014806 [Oxalis oulophora]
MTIKKFIKKRNNMNIINSSKISLRFASKKRRHSAKKGLGLMNRLEKVNEKIRVLNDNQKKIAAYINNFETRLQGNKEAQMHTENEDQGHGEGDLENGICSMKFIATCLNEIEDGFYCDGIYSTDQEKHLVENRWGFDFWRSYSDGNDILAKNGSEATMEQIAWIASVSTETITRKVCEGLTLDTPFLLFLVPSKEKAAQVRSVCQHIKTKGIHTVNLHSGASLDHQVSGLKSVEPEFIVSTPERLWELVCLKAVDISTASLLVLVYSVLY